jgi:hypothetical protein
VGYPIPPGADTADVKLTRGKSVFLLLFGAWSWFIWVTLVINVAQDPRAFVAGSATAFFYVHLTLAIISIVFGTIIGLFGVRGLVASRRPAEVAHPG